MADLIAGNVKVMVDSLASALPNIQGGRIRPLAVTGRETRAAAADVPTVAETASPGVRGAGLVRHRGAGRHAARDHPAGQCRCGGDPARPRHGRADGQLGGFPDPGTPESSAASSLPRSRSGGRWRGRPMSGWTDDICLPWLT
jgi:hypothetical protein